MAANQFQGHLIEFLTQPLWGHCNRSLVGGIQGRNPEGREGNSCLTIQVKPESAPLVQRDRFLSREKPDTERQRRIRRPGNRSRVRNKNKRGTDRKAVANVWKAWLAGFSVAGNRTSMNVPSAITRASRGVGDREQSVHESRALSVTLVRFALGPYERAGGKTSRVLRNEHGDHAGGFFLGFHIPQDRRLDVIGRGPVFRPGKAFKPPDRRLIEAERDGPLGCPPT